MSFREDLKKTKGLEKAYCAGLGALRSADLRKVSAKSSRRIAGSADIDSSLAALYPQSARWDYVIATRPPKGKARLHWVEIHPASSKHSIREIAAKLKWLRLWWRDEGSHLGRHAAEIIWIASGSTSFRSGSPQSKQIANMGVRFVGNHYTLGD